MQQQQLTFAATIANLTTATNVRNNATVRDLEAALMKRQELL
jgi:hypothetical protein